MPPDPLPAPAPPLAIPLGRWADRQISALAELTRSPAIARISGAGLLGERAVLNGFAIPLRRSGGGGCELLQCLDGWVALNLSRSDDRALLPALLLAEHLDPAKNSDIARHVAQHRSNWLVTRGREMGLALAALDEVPVSPACAIVAQGTKRDVAPNRAPLVVDISALWAGPVAAHLLWLAGAEVVKVESAKRPDAMRHGDPALFGLLNQGKSSVSLDLTHQSGRAALAALIERADIVIEAARPRALRNMGIIAEDFLARRPGLVWVTITGHGTNGAAADWVGFGDDCAVAGGLSAAMLTATDVPCLVGDAMADPLTGIRAALETWRLWQSGTGGRLVLSMSGVVAEALAQEDPALLRQELIDWAGAIGQPFPGVPPRAVFADLRALGADTDEWAPC